MDWLEAEQRDHRLLLIAALLQAGLFMTHARVSIYGACFVVTHLICESITRLRRKGKDGNLELWGRATLLGLLAGALSGPWVARVVANIAVSLRAAGRTLRGAPSYNVFPWNLLLIPRNRELMALAAIGAVWGLIHHKKGILLTVTWCVVVGLMLNPAWLGIAATDFVNNATAVVSLFLPLSVLCGQAITLMWDRVHPLVLGTSRRLGLCRAQLASQALLAALIVGVALWGTGEMFTIVNPVTVLATIEDLDAMNWINENTPPDALFLINTRHWQQGTYVGTDGGYWIPQLTGRRALLPALSYTYGAPRYVQHIADTAKTVSHITGASDPGLPEILEREGVTHVYIGAKGGPLTPEMLLGNALYRPAYSNGAVWVFEVVKDEQGITRDGNDALN